MQQNRCTVVQNHTFSISTTRSKNHPRRPHSGEVFGTKIVSRSRKSHSETDVKIHTIFNIILYRFLLHFGLPGRPKNPRFFNFLSSCCRSRATWAPRGIPKCSKRAPDLDFQGFGTVLRTILDHFFTDSRVYFNKKIQKNISIILYIYI